MEMKILYYIHLFLGVMGLSLASSSDTIQHLTFKSSHSQWHEDRVTEERSGPGNLMQIICLSVMQCSYSEKVTHNEILKSEHLLPDMKTICALILAYWH